MPDIKIFQTFHKDYPSSADRGLLQPVGVGGYRHEGFESDASGANIAALNPHYCELTVQYWAWKNTRSDYVGFCHYRRLLNFMPDQTWAAAGNASLPLEQSTVDYLGSPHQQQRLTELLGTWDVVVPRPLRMLPSIQTQYLGCVQHAPWNEFQRCIKLMYSQKSGASNYFQLASEAPMWNMFVMRRDLFEEYCADLFLVIDSVFAAVGTPYDSYQNRYPGFLAERFLGFWLHMKRVRQCSVPIVYFG